MEAAAGFNDRPETEVVCRPPSREMPRQGSPLEKQSQAGAGSGRGGQPRSPPRKAQQRVALNSWVVERGGEEDSAQDAEASDGGKVCRAGMDTDFEADARRKPSHRNHRALSQP